MCVWVYVSVYVCVCLSLYDLLLKCILQNCRLIEAPMENCRTIALSSRYCKSVELSTIPCKTVAISDSLEPCGWGGGGGGPTMLSPHSMFGPCCWVHKGLS